MGSPTAHIIGTGLESLAIVLAVGSSAIAFGNRFRRYAIGTILILLLFGAIAGSDISRIEAHLPTPWLGITERINIYAYLLWMVVLAVAILRGRDAVGADAGGGSGGAGSPLTRPLK